MSSVEIHASIGRMLAAANGAGATADWTPSTATMVLCLAAFVVSGCSVLAWLSDPEPVAGPPPHDGMDILARRFHRGPDDGTAAVVWVCFRSWTRIGRWAEDLGCALATMRLL
jgi:hypothetical protein